MSRVYSLLAVIVLAVTLHGCLAAYKEITDIYDAVFGIPADELQEIFAYHYNGVGSYCFPAGSVALEGRIHQQLAERSSLLVIARLLNGLGDPLWSWRKKMVVRRDGTMPKREWPWEGLCIESGQSLSVSVKPAFDINPNVRVWTRWVYDSNPAPW
jgi:hypothetical protein